MTLLLVQGGGRLRLRGGGIMLLQSQTTGPHPRAPSARSVDAGFGLTTLTWVRPLDPHEIIFYSINWAEELDGTNDSIRSDGSFWTLSGTAIAAGIINPGGANSHDSRSATIWLSIDESRKGDDIWLAGQTHVLTHRIETIGGQTLERVINLTVRSFQN